MGRIVVSEFLSLDGVMEAPGGEPGYAHSGWTMDAPDEGQYGYKLDEVLASEALLLGRVTYEGFAAAWPERDDEAGFAAKMNAMPKFVVSRTLTDPAWSPTRVLHGDVAEEAARLKDEVDGDILVAGSRTLVQSLLANDLVDELRAMIFPVVLGSGRRLYAETERKLPLKLVDTRTYGQVVVHAYRPVRAAAERTSAGSSPKR